MSGGQGTAGSRRDRGGWRRGCKSAPAPVSPLRNPGYVGAMRTLPRPAPAIVYGAAALFPAALLTLGALAGGAWIWAGFLWVAVISQAIDTLAARALPDPEEGVPHPGADAVSLVLVAAHLLLLSAALRALAGFGPLLTWPQHLALFLGTGMFMGQVSNATAHELIHRGSRLLFRAGALVYVTLLFGHHVSAHRLVHHRHVATDADPNSARAGESFWRFFPRAWAGSFRAGLAVERDLTARQPGRVNPYVWWVGGAVACVALAAAALGARGALIYVLLCLYAQMQLMLSDYVQHYGLRRATLPDGRAEPVDARHSWDAPHLLSSLMLVNAPRHSDHHAHPSRPYPALRLNRAQASRPLLPWSLPVMGAIALVPPLWRRVMDRRVARMRALARPGDAPPVPSPTG